MEWTDYSYVLDKTVGYVYMLLGARDEILYVGATTESVPVRWRGHESAHGKGWTAPVRRVVGTPMPVENLWDKEAELIHEHHPVLNSKCPVGGCFAYFTVRKKRANTAKENMLISVQENLTEFFTNTSEEFIGGDELRAFLRRRLTISLNNHKLGLAISTHLGPSQVAWHPEFRQAIRGWDSQLARISLDIA